MIMCERGWRWGRWRIQWGTKELLQITQLRLMREKRHNQGLIWGCINRNCET